MRFRLLLLSSVLSLGTALAYAQDPLAGVTKLYANGVGTGTTGAATGVLNGEPFGTATWTLSFMPTSAPAGNCNSGRGTIQITTHDGSTIQMQHAGVSCNTSGPGTNQAIDNTVYIIVSGTGRFANATGTGSVAFASYSASDPTSLAYIHFDGNIDLH